MKPIPGIQTRYRFSRWLTVFILAMVAGFPHGSPVPAFAQVQLTGSATTPVSPVTLKDGDSFSCSSLAALKFQDGTAIRFSPGASGSVNPKAFKLGRGKAYVALGKPDSAFVIEVPRAVLEARGIDFLVSCDKETLFVVMLDGKMGITSSEAGFEPVKLSSGETFEWNSERKLVRRTKPADIGAGFPPLPDSSKRASNLRFRYEDLFPYSMGFYREKSIFKDGNALPRVVGPGNEIKSAAQSGNEVRFLNGTSARLGENSRIKLTGNGIEILEGSCLVRNAQGAFPFEIGGDSPVTLNDGATAEISRQEGGLIGKVWTGTVSAGETRIEPGNTFAAKPSGTTMIDPQRIFRGSNPIGGEVPADLMTDFDDGDEFTESDATPEPSPVPEGPAGTTNVDGFPKGTGTSTDTETSTTGSGGQPSPPLDGSGQGPVMMEPVEPEGDQ